ncbi:ssDNA endonuclease and repair protein rad10 [Serendipita sp. 399]|nr:ssDNA endonuclease and repair protein rad10 [Serendipita sp. 399]
MVAWTPEEAGVYLSTYKLFEHKPPDLIKERVDNDYTSILRSVLTSVKGVNKTDVMTLRTNFGVRETSKCLLNGRLLIGQKSFSNIVHATPEQLLDCPGFGNLKVRRLKEAVDMPFRPRKSNLGISSTQALGPNPILDSDGDDAGGSNRKGKEKPSIKPQPRNPSPDWPEWVEELEEFEGREAPTKDLAKNGD